MHRWQEKGIANHGTNANLLARVKSFPEMLNATMNRMIIIGICALSIIHWQSALLIENQRADRSSISQVLDGKHAHRISGL
jgi:hypothetical protein